MIVSSGYNIGAPEVENALLAHPAVAECAVIGVALPRARAEGEGLHRRCANFAEPSAELTEKLQDFVKDQIAPYKYPREIEFVDALPKTATGKSRRAELRKRPIDRQHLFLGAGRGQGRGKTGQVQSRIEICSFGVGCIGEANLP